MAAQESFYYHQQSFARQALPPCGTKETQFAECIFSDCDFTDDNFGSCHFSDCQFFDCNFSMIKFNKTGLADVYFTGCKLLGADFSGAKDFLFGVDFDNCVMDYVNFSRKKNRKHRWKNCVLKGADFSDADLANVVFQACNLDSAVFADVNLQGADFSTSSNLSLDPEKNYLNNCKFSLANLPGLLTKYKIKVTDD